MMHSMRRLPLLVSLLILLLCQQQLVLSQEPAAQPEEIQSDHAQPQLRPEPEAQQLQVPRPRGRIRIGGPLPPPAGPVSAVVPGLGWPSYVAAAPGLAPMPATSTVHTHIPLLRETSAPAPPSDGVVYGNWKPQQPLKPDENEAQPKQRVYGRLEAMLMGLPAEGKWKYVIDPHHRNYITIKSTAMDRGDASSEEMLQPQPEERTASVNYNPYARRDSFERSQESRGRWRPPTPYASPQTPVLPQSSIEIVRMNATDPLLRAMAKQINESIETTTVHRQRTQTTEDSWMPLPYPYPTHSYEITQPSVPTLQKSSEIPTLRPHFVPESTTIALNWPTDFLDTQVASTQQSYTDSGQSIDRIDNIDSIDRIDEDLVDQSDDYKFFEEGVNSAQTHNELSIPETLIPQLPLNITRVGIPYEDRNSNEEPTICVPLTVTETASESAASLMVEVERVYCFPLPKVEIRTGKIRQQQNEPIIDMENRASTNSISSTTFATTTEPPQLVSASSGSRLKTAWTTVLLLGIWSSLLRSL